MDLDLEQIYTDLVKKNGTEKTPKVDQNIVTVVFVRHGQSIMNRDGVFQGWVDAPLSDKGESQCKNAGKILKDHGYKFDVAYTSRLNRATTTTDIILEEMGHQDVTHVHKTWRLNERHYGNLQGKSKQMTVEEYGYDQV